MFSCPTCDYTTEYKCNLTKHEPRCKQGEKKGVYVCKNCNHYVTDNKCNFQKHINSKLCKNRSTMNFTLEQRVIELEKTVYKLQQHLPQIELPDEEDETKQRIIKTLKKHNVHHHADDTIDELRRLNRELSARLRREKESKV